MNDDGVIYILAGPKHPRTKSWFFVSYVRRNKHWTVDRKSWL